MKMNERWKGWRKNIKNEKFEKEKKKLLVGQKYQNKTKKITQGSSVETFKRRHRKKKTDVSFLVVKFTTRKETSSLYPFKKPSHTKPKEL